MKEAYLEGADIRGADLREAKELYTEQLEETIGDKDTLLPDWVQRPLSWEYGTEIPLRQELTSQEYSSKAFEPTMRFTLGANWKALNDIPDQTTLYYDFYYDTSEMDAQLSFANVQQVFDRSNPTYNPQRPSLNNVSPPPEDLAGWLQNHPYLDVVGKPIHKSVDGVPAVQLDVVIDSTPTDYPSNCPRPCVPLFLDSKGEWSAVYKGNKSRVLILDIEGEAVVFSVEAPTDDSNEFFRKAQKVIDSVRWVDTLEVPDLSGESLEEVESQVGQDFELEPSYRHSGKQEGLVLNQKLLPGESAAQGSDLPLTVSRGPEPGVTYQTIGDASGTLIELGADETWTRSVDQKGDRVTVVAPDRQINVIVSRESIDPSYDARGYADEQDKLKKQEFPGYYRRTYEVTDAFGVTGFEQVFEWDPKDGPPVKQIQQYYAEDGRGYTATATARLADFKELEPQLRDVLDRTTLIR